MQSKLTFSFFYHGPLLEKKSIRKQYLPAKKKSSGPRLHCSVGGGARFDKSLFY